MGLISELERFPGKQNSYPLQYSCLQNSMDRRAWRAIVHRAEKSQTQLSIWHIEYGVEIMSIIPRTGQERVRGKYILNFYHIQRHRTIVCLRLFFSRVPWLPSSNHWGAVSPTALSLANVSLCMWHWL